VLARQRADQVLGGGPHVRGSREQVRVGVHGEVGDRVQVNPGRGHRTTHSQGGGVRTEQVRVPHPVQDVPGGDLIGGVRQCPDVVLELQEAAPAGR